MTEGYGLNAQALETLKTAGTRLVISVDCGITAVREAESARSIGLDLIITDHHEFDRLTRSNGSQTVPTIIFSPMLMRSFTPGSSCLAFRLLSGSP